MKPECGEDEEVCVWVAINRWVYIAMYRIATMFHTLSKLPGERSAPIDVGIISSSNLTKKLITQIECAPGMVVSAVTSTEKNQPSDLFENINIPDDEIWAFDEAAAASAAISTGNRAIVYSGADLAKIDLDVIIEASDTVNKSARNAIIGIMNSTDVIMANVETDSTVGPLLVEFAKQNGVTYSLAYGDQPSLICELAGWAQTIGFDIIAAGKGEATRSGDRFVVPSDIPNRVNISEKTIERRSIDLASYTANIDGTRTAFEMCTVANATGLVPDVRGMHRPAGNISEIPRRLSPKSDGGILNSKGVVDTIRTIHPDGSVVSHDISSGVFIITSSPSQYIQQYLVEEGDPMVQNRNEVEPLRKEGMDLNNTRSNFYTSQDGKYQIFFRPYHLPAVEMTVSIANIAHRNEPTGQPYARTAEVVGAAKRDLHPGVTLDDAGGKTTYGLLIDSDTADSKEYVPFAFLKNAQIIRSVERDEIITWDDIELKDNIFIRQLRGVHVDLDSPLHGSEISSDLSNRVHYREE